jgi:hypothetical protein
MHPEDAVTAHGHIYLENIRQKKPKLQRKKYAARTGKEQIKNLYQHSRKYKEFLPEEKGLKKWRTTRTIRNSNKRISCDTYASNLGDKFVSDYHNPKGSRGRPKRLVSDKHSRK